MLLLLVYELNIRSREKGGGKKERKEGKENLLLIWFALFINFLFLI